MKDEAALIELIERDVISFSDVSGFPGIGFTANIQNMLNRDRSNPSIKISEDDDELTINCEIRVYFGVNIPQLCYDIQTKVKKDVESFTGLTVRAVNIRIEGIDEEHSIGSEQ